MSASVNASCVRTSCGRGAEGRDLAAVWPLRVLVAVEHDFDVDDRRAVDGLNRTDPQAIPYDLLHGHTMKAHWIRTVWRARGENPGQPTAWIRAGMNLHYVAPGLVQPGEDNDVVAGSEAVEGGGSKPMDFQPGIGCALRALPGRFAPLLEWRPENTNWAKAGALQGFAAGAGSRGTSFLRFHRHARSVFVKP